MSAAIEFGALEAKRACRRVEHGAHHSQTLRSSQRAKTGAQFHHPCRPTFGIGGERLRAVYQRHPRRVVVEFVDECKHLRSSGVGRLERGRHVHVSSSLSTR